MRAESDMTHSPEMNAADWSASDLGLAYWLRGPKAGMHYIIARLQRLERAGGGGVMERKGGGCVWKRKRGRQKGKEK